MYSRASIACWLSFTTSTNFPNLPEIIWVCFIMRWYERLYFIINFVRCKSNIMEDHRELQLTEG